MTYAQIVDKARQRAFNGTFTDKREELAGDVYLVKDMQQVIDAFIKDIEAGDTAVYDSPEDFLNYHGIEWE